MPAAYQARIVDSELSARLAATGAVAIEGPKACGKTAANLHRFAKQIDTDRCGPPAMLGVIVGAGYGYARDDGLSVIPIGALRP
jgi:hypothetical protein